MVFELGLTGVREGGVGGEHRKGKGRGLSAKIRSKFGAELLAIPLALVTRFSDGLNHRQSRQQWILSNAFLLPNGTPSVP
jgi:hypothetical protein